MQGWNCKKDIAHCLKTFAPKPLSTVKPSIYGPRFYSFFVEKFKASNDKNSQYFCEKIRKNSTYERKDETGNDTTDTAEVVITV